MGSLAAGNGDRFSDLDLTFAIADHVSVNAVLEDWTTRLSGELDAMWLVDLKRGLTVYRVFLLADALQLDLSMTPAAKFRPAGPRFRLLFGDTVAGEPEPPTPPADLFTPTPTVVKDLFGWGVIYALHARVSIERRRVWQAEHYVGAVRDHAVSLACLRHGLPAVQARRYDDLPPETLTGVQGDPRRRDRACGASHRPRCIRAGASPRGYRGRTPQRERHRRTPRETSLTPTRPRRVGGEAPVPALSAGGFLAAALRTGRATCAASGSP